MKVALVHDWLTGMRGGEKCLEAFCELFPQADLYTLLHCPKTVSQTIECHPIHTSFIQRLPFSYKKYRHYLPLYPMAIASFDFSRYDLIVSSSHCVAKGVHVPKGVCHIAYLHTPMRYIWDQYAIYFNRDTASLPIRAAMKMVRPWLQYWDTHSNNGIHVFMANSAYVAARIKRYYNREAHVVHPPVDFDRFSASAQDEGFYLMVTAFVPYKRVDLAILAFNQLKWPLTIIGTGPDKARLMALAGPTITFLEGQSNYEIKRAYAKCRAVIFPGEEDFGIVPLEAMASGKQVIAYGKGGVLETVIPGNGPEPTQEGPTGVFFYEQTPQALVDAVLYFEEHQRGIDPIRIREHVKSFSKEQFKEKIARHIEGQYQAFKDKSHAETAN